MSIFSLRDDYMMNDSARKLCCWLNDEMVAADARIFVGGLRLILAGVFDKYPDHRHEVGARRIGIFQWLITSD
jgi:hypothetical protein